MEMNANTQNTAQHHELETYFSGGPDALDGLSNTLFDGSFAKLGSALVRNRRKVLHAWGLASMAIGAVALVTCVPRLGEELKTKSPPRPAITANSSDRPMPLSP